MSELHDRVRADFPLLAETIDGSPVVYLDCASTTPKPLGVIEAVTRYYEHFTANVHRSLHPFGEKATEAYEGARYAVAGLIGASPAEIVFTRNATEAFNLVAHSIALEPGDEVILPATEHHSNFLPWRTLATPVLLPTDSDGVPRYQEIEGRITRKTRLATVAQVSNVTGTIAPVKEWVEAAHRRGVPAMIDASQSASHLPIDVRALEVDFLAFSGHKLLGPSGVGVLYARADRMAKLTPYQTGGGMVATVQEGEGGLVLRDPPWRFEAGTPAIEAAIGLGAAVEYLRGLGMEEVKRHSLATGRLLAQAVASVPGTRILGGAEAERVALVTFTAPVPSVAADGIARLLADAHGILVSGGYHCAHILHHRLDLKGTVRASGHVFTSPADVDALRGALQEMCSA